jgi:hypothetical protein
MKLLFVNYSLDSYGRFKLYGTDTNLPTEDYVSFGEDGLGKQWSEYSLLTFSTDGAPTVTSTIHKQAPLRKNIVLNKRKKKCSSTPTPQSDLSPLQQQLGSTPTWLQPPPPPTNWSSSPSDFLAALTSLSAETPLSEASIEPVATVQETELF